MSTDSDQRVKTLKTVRGKDIKIRYTQDNLEDSLINQRVSFDQNNNILTPITPKLLERQVEINTPTIPRLGGIEPRTITTCFSSVTTLSGKSKFVVLVPYAPGDERHSEHITELSTYISSSSNLNPSTPLSLSYQGENQI